jgi:hypothetical protein
MPPPVNHPLWTSVTKTATLTPITMHKVIPTPVAQMAQPAHLEARSSADVQRFIDAARGNTLIKPKLVQDPDNATWLERLPTDLQRIEVRATTAEDLEARERETVVANLVGRNDRRSDRDHRKLTDVSKDSSLQRRHAKRGDHNTGIETIPCSDPHVSSMWYCNGLGPRDLSIGAELAAKKHSSEARFQWSKYEPTNAEKNSIAQQAKAYIAYVQATGTEEDLERAKHKAMAMAGLSHTREKALRYEEDLAKAGKMIEMQKVAVILLSVFLGVMVFGRVFSLLLVLSRRSKKRAEERAEGRVIELQVRAGGANVDEAK